MLHRLLRYEVRKDALPDALAATRAFVDEVGRKEGGTASYKAFQDKAAPTRFTHLMAFRVANAEQYHKATPWMKAFLAKVQPLCVAPFAYEDLAEVEPAPR